MKLRQKSVWLATETKPGAREDCAEVATRNKVVTEGRNFLCGLFLNLKKITANYDDDLCKDCFRDMSLQELGKEYNCVVCLQNGKKVSAR